MEKERAILYLRKGEEDNLPAMRRRCEEQGLTVVEEIVDSRFVANEENGDGWGTLWLRVFRGSARVVVVFSFHTLGNDTLSMLKVIGLAKTMKVRVLSLREPFDPHDPLGRLSILCARAIAQYDAETRGSRR
jgi:hypothetical protein